MAGQAKAQSATDFAMHTIPVTIVGCICERRHFAGSASSGTVWLRTVLYG